MLLSPFPPLRWKLCVAVQKDRQQDHDVEPQEKGKPQLGLKEKSVASQILTFPIITSMSSVLLSETKTRYFAVF